MLHSMPYIADDKSKLLILGSMPGAESLKRQQYYAHPMNRFWKIMFKFFGAEFSDDYSKRIELIKNNGIALWDSISSCRREGSLDSNITDIKPNDIMGLLTKFPNIQNVIVNGRKSEQSFKKHFELPVCYLPSTSPANASLSFDNLYVVWSQKLASFLI